MQEKLILRLTFNPGLALTGFRATRPIFSKSNGAFVFIILQIFFPIHAVLKSGEYSQIFPSFSWGIFGHDMFKQIVCKQKYLMDY